MSRPDCPLCGLEKLTEWYGDTPTYAILRCRTCGDLMAVWRRHTMRPGVGALSMLEALRQVADRQYGEDNWKFRFHQRTILDHWHVHAVKL